MSCRTVRALAARVFVVLCLIALAGAPATAAEQVTRFAAEVAVQPSGDLMVTETIAVRAEGDRIRRGIYRTVPLAGPEGRRMGFSLVSADHQGRPVPTEVTRDDAGVRVRLGDPGQDLVPGEHVFTLTYRASGTVLAGAEADSLEWNVTGSGWEFPIAEAALRLTLPGATPPLSWQVATGAPGSGESNAETTLDPDGALTGRTLAGLPPGHGMTVRVALPKGLVQAAAAAATDEPAPAPAEAEPAALDVLPIVLGGLGVVLVYYGAAWWWAGRDPAAGRIVPRPLPPANMSPAAVRFVRRMGYDNRCLAAALVNMAVNGWLTIDRRPDGGWLLRRTGAPDDVLFPEERAVAGKLFFAMAFERSLDDADGRWLRQASDALKEALAQGNADRLFVTNRLFLGVGIVLSLIAGGAMMVGSTNILEGLFVGAFIGIFGAIGAYVGVQAWRRTRRVMGGRGIGDSLLWLLGALPAIAIAAIFGVAMLMVTPPLAVVGIVLLIAVNVFFAWALKAPTADGRRVQDEIEGLAAFLIAAGGSAGAAAAVADPALPPDRYLPYALALDLETAWATAFGAALAAGAAGAAVAGSGSGADLWVWYGGGSHDAGTLAGDLGDGLTGDIDRASAPPPDDSDSPSSSGGVSVGGGFGGGGGGGF